MNKVYNKVKWQVKNKIIRLTNSRKKIVDKDKIFVFGSGRSGTNWVSDLIAQSIEAVVIHEPLKVNNSKRVQEVGFTGWGQYIPEQDTNWSEAFLFFEDLLNGKTINPNHLKGSLIDYCQKHTLLYRFIGGNLLMPWVIQNFRLSYKPIFILRNPYSVVASQLNHPAWYSKRTTFPVAIPKFRYYDVFYSQYQPLFSIVRNRVEMFTAMWVLQNESIINNSAAHNWITVQYERLFVDPQIEMKNLLKKLGISSQREVNPNIESKSVITPLVHNQQLKYKASLKEEEIDNITRILAASKIPESFYEPFATS